MYVGILTLFVLNDVVKISGGQHVSVKTQWSLNCTMSDFIIDMCTIPNWSLMLYTMLKISLIFSASRSCHKCELGLGVFLCIYIFV